MSVPVLNCLLIVSSQKSVSQFLNHISTQFRTNTELTRRSTPCYFGSMLPYDPFDTNFRAISYSEVTIQFCRLPWPTLIYFTRVYKTWRPDAVMSTDLSKRDKLARIFMDHPNSSGHNKKRCALSRLYPILHIKWFEGHNQVSKRR